MNIYHIRIENMEMYEHHVDSKKFNDGSAVDKIKQRELFS